MAPNDINPIILSNSNTIELDRLLANPLPKKYYEKAKSSQHDIYLGSQKRSQYDRWDDCINQYFENPTHANNVLHPEAENDEWSIEINQAFIAGGIEAKRNFVLVTPYQNFKNKNYPSNCLKEIAWLWANGYRGTIHEGRVIFKPTEEPHLSVTLIDYENPVNHPELMLTKNKALTFSSQQDSNRKNNYQQSSNNYFPQSNTRRSHHSSWRGCENTPKNRQFRSTQPKKPCPW